MPHQERCYRSNRADSTDQRRDEMDALVDQAIDEAMAAAETATIADEAADWLADIDEALGENAACAETFMRDWVQKGGE